VEGQLAALGAEIAQYTGKPLDQRTEDEKAEIAQLNDQLLERLRRQNPAPTKKPKPALVPLAEKLREMGCRMVPPLEVRRPAVGAGEPPFCAEHGWLERLSSCVSTHMDQTDKHDQDGKVLDRVPPLALIRCSRGGKTRALLELAAAFRKQRPKVAVIFVSFNNDTSVDEWELEEPVNALWRRIAFAALDITSPTKQDWKKFANTSVTSEDIMQWLGQTPCLLLIDELNLLNCGKDVAEFLKDHFLSPVGRYFVFSSHVVPASQTLSRFMDNTSLRKVLIWELPLVVSMDDAGKLGWRTITIREVLSRGRLPGLIAVTRADAEGYEPPVAEGYEPPVYATRDAAISSVFSQWNDESAKCLLDSFLTGGVEGVPEPLLQFMNASSSGKIIWVPFHMEHVLSSCARSQTLSAPIRAAVRAIAKAMLNFEGGKTAGGDTWEALFVVALLIRLVTGEIDILFPQGVGLESYGISYNKLWDPKKTWEFAKDLSDLLAGMVAPTTFPHIAVYYPPLANFALYDVVIVLYNATGKATCYGYQLKEGKGMPRPAADKRCEMSFVVRGAAPEDDDVKRGWIVLGKESVDEILGLTGKSLAPEVWRKMKN
jgi:hypothetical protein